MISKTHQETISVTSGAKQVELSFEIRSLGSGRSLPLSPEDAAILGLELLAHARKQGWVPSDPAVLFVPEGLERSEGCTCPQSCGTVCKGACGCRSCCNDYSDFLSAVDE